MKLCKNCAHFRAPPYSGSVTEYARCMSGMRASPVTGIEELPTQSSPYCISLRQSKNQTDCGPEARFFVSRELITDPVLL